MAKRRRQTGRALTAIAREQASEACVRVVSTIERVARHVLGPDDPEHDDVVQRSLENWLERLSDGKVRSPRRSAQLAAMVTRNVAIDVRRARSRERRFEARGDSRDDERAPSSEWSHLDPERIVSAREEVARFVAALGKLRTTMATVVYRHDVLEQGLNEIAHALGVSPAAAQSRLVRGRRQMARLLQAQFDETRKAETPRENPDRLIVAFA